MKIEQAHISIAMQTQCSECDRLWKEYEGVVFEQTRAINVRSRIAFEYDTVSYRRICIEVNRLTQARSDAQLRIRTHNRETHLQDAACLVWTPAANGASHQA